MNKKVLAVAVSSALATPMAAHAVKYKLSGQVNRVIVYNNDGQNSDVQFLDNTSSGTRWRMNGSEEIGNGMKVGFNWEWQNGSNKGSHAIKSGDSSPVQDMRKAEVWFSGGWGKLSIGQGPGAGDGTTEVDLSSTWNASAYNGRSDAGGGVFWRTSAGAGITALGGGGGTTGATPTALTVSDTFNQFDSFGRYDRIRYDSPSLGPVTLSVSAGQTDLYEGAARWSQSLGGGQISAGLFYASHAGGGIDSRYGGSVGYLFSFGTNIQGSYTENEPSASGSTKGKTWYLKVGHNWGNNSASIGYGESKDIVAGFKNKGFNIGFNHNIPKAKVDLYAGLTFHQLDEPSGGVGVDDVYAFSLGTKLKFD